MTPTETLATLATAYGLITVCAPIIQTVRIHQRKASDDISLLALWIFMGSYVVWLAYGIALHNWPLMIVDSVGILTNASTIILAYRHRSTRRGKKTGDRT